MSSPRSKARVRLRVEPLEPRVLLASDFYSLDGTGNNLANPDWGSADATLLRMTTANYADDVSQPISAANSRQISNRVADILTLPPEIRIRDRRGLTDMHWQWGQFLTHDIDESGGSGEFQPIAVPTGDPGFDPEGTGQVIIPFERSSFDPQTGTDPSNPRQQTNHTTAFIDGSNVYGADDVRSAALRSFEGGKLLLSDDGLLPFNESGLINDPAPTPDFFLAGDPRANENLGLISLHTIFAREHNRQAEQLAVANPDWTDEVLYQQARGLVIAEIQVITYREFLPSLLGSDVIDVYQGYDESVNPGLSNIFASSAFRLGHSMVSGRYSRLDEIGDSISAGPVSLSDSFFRPELIIDEGGIEPVLRGLARGIQQAVDPLISSSLRTFSGGGMAFDLAAINIERQHDRGMPGYNQARIELGLGPKDNFSDITSNEEFQRRLTEAFGTVDDLDLWTGGLVEDHLPESGLGELFTTVVADQFERLRDGDRMWYENNFTPDEIRDLENTRLSDILRANGPMASLQEFVLVAQAGQPPVPDAGPDRNVGVQETVTLNGVISRPDGRTAIAWSVISGPDTPTFSDASVAETQVTFNTPGEYVLQLRASGRRHSNADHVKITVNLDPIATNNVYSIEIGARLRGNVLTDDSGEGVDHDPDGDPLAVNIAPISGPTNFRLFFLLSDGSLFYRPNRDFVGTDSFVYEISDGRGGTATATVTIHVGQEGLQSSIVTDLAAKQPSLAFPLGRRNR